jgi:hypothetical protein
MNCKVFFLFLLVLYPSVYARADSTKGSSHGITNSNSQLVASNINSKNLDVASVQES